jgi:hypothetical protein
MRPVFASTKQAATFALLLLLLLAAPGLSGMRLLPHQQQTYYSEGIQWGNFPWLQQFVFDETNDIDIALVGSSQMIYGIDTPYVQQKLDEQLGRKTVVRTVAWMGGGMDTLFYTTRALLAHRHVKTLVFFDEITAPKPDEINLLANYYYGDVVWMPRNLLDLSEPNWPRVPGAESSPPANPATYERWRSANPAEQLGCMNAHLGFAWRELNTNFTPYVPQTGATPAEVLVFPRTPAANWVCSNWPPPLGQAFFARQLGLLAQQQGCRLVALHKPVFADRTARVVVEAHNWPALMQAEVCLMGIPEAQLFAGLSESEVELLYWNANHFNENGQVYFTRLITPPLVQYYESHVVH